MLRLLGRVRERSGDPELFAGLVQACRYAGLQRPAIRAYEHARRLEPQIRTAVTHAYFAAGDLVRTIEVDADDPPVVTAFALDLLGRREEAAAHVRQHLTGNMPALLRALGEMLEATLEGWRAEALTAADAVVAKWHLRDPCGTSYLARNLALLDHPEAVTTLRRAIEGGFHAYTLFTRDPWLDPLRLKPGFSDILRIAETGYHGAAESFAAAGGERLLGPA